MHAYGKVKKICTEQVRDNLCLQGQYFDAKTGLHYNRHHYYDLNGRSYITADPIGLVSGLNNFSM
ncbi:RHS repeat-associated core domain-containing protein [Pasteurella atlantica]|uniref:RHS repeat-associated core domain-containing protein n=1 Tax=Pasteurellaceae TaxID=712 RepID=UPI003B75C260